MKKYIFYPLLVLVALVFVFYFSTQKIPSRDLVFGGDEKINEESGLKKISDFFKNVFEGGDMAVLVMGRPGVGYNAGNLVDALGVVYFNSASGKIYLISLPRDLWITDGEEQFKINEVLTKNKTGVVLGKVREITGIELDGYSVIDLGIIRDAIDGLGGIEVVLDEPAVDWVSGYTLGVGSHQLNGEDAVWLIRNRYNKEGDFFREKNQQKIIKSAFEKFKSLPNDEKISFFNKFIIKSGVLLSTKIDASKLIPLLFELKTKNISMESIVMDFSTKLFKTSSVPILNNSTSTFISVVIPSAGFEDYSEIRDYIKNKINPR